MPNFSLLNSASQAVGPSDLHQVNGVVVAFIHATWCSSCLRQLRRLNAVFPKLEELEVGLTCISADTPDILYAYEQSSDPPLRYPLLADSVPSVAHKFGNYDPNPDHESPFPAVFFAGADNKIAYADVSSDPACFPNMAQLLEVVESSLSDQ